MTALLHVLERVTSVESGHCLNMLAVALLYKQAEFAAFVRTLSLNTDLLLNRVSVHIRMRGLGLWDRMSTNFDGLS